METVELKDIYMTLLKAMPCTLGMILMFRFIFLPLLDRILDRRISKGDDDG